MWQVLSLLAAAAAASRHSFGGGFSAISASKVASSTASLDAPHAYGHAFSRPHDFTDDQIRSIAERFEIFTVEKKTGQNKYGPKSSLAATIGTAQRIKDINSNVKVLMYWNAAIHWNFYECESEVQESWLVKPKPRRGKPYYDYSEPAFREWWVQCAINSIQNSEGMLDGLFLDATPKVVSRRNGVNDPQVAQDLWLTMVSQIREALGESAILVNNGFFLGGRDPTRTKLAGDWAWVGSGTTYIESLSKRTSPEREIFHMRWIADASAANPSLRMIGRGDMSAGQVDDDPVFKFGLAKFLLVCASVKDSWFLATKNYDINVNGGQLQQPTSVYLEGVGCGEPTASFVQHDFVLSRSFEHGTVTVDIEAGTGSISCGEAVSTLLREEGAASERF